LFESKQRALLLEQAEVEEKLREVEHGSDATFTQLEKTVELAKNAPMLYKMAIPENKRKLLKILLSNLTASGKNVAMSLTIPFCIIAEREKTNSGAPHRGTCRTWEQLLHKIYDWLSNKPSASS
jgi:hypothetical protein